jgi:hypothetical protein
MRTTELSLWSTRKRPLGRSRSSWVDNIKIYLGERVWGGVRCNGLAHDRDKCRGLVNAVMNLWETTSGYTTVASRVVLSSMEFESSPIVDVNSNIQCQVCDSYSPCTSRLSPSTAAHHVDSCCFSSEPVFVRIVSTSKLIFTESMHIPVYLMSYTLTGGSDSCKGVRS